MPSTLYMYHNNLIMKCLLAIDFLCFSHLTFTSYATRSDGMIASGLMLSGVWGVINKYYPNCRLHGTFTLTPL